MRNEELLEGANSKKGEKAKMTMEKKEGHDETG
jgi:hypothetical protein